MNKKKRAPHDPVRKKRFRETARDLLHMAKVKRQMGQAVDAAGSLAAAMEKAYQLGFADAFKDSERLPEKTKPVVGKANSDAMPWTLIPPRTRNTFWSICLASLGREQRTTTPSYLTPAPTQRGTSGWQLVVPDRQTYERLVGNGTIETLLRLELLQKAADGLRVTFSEYGIRTWNRFCERGGYWPDDLVEKLP